MSVRTTADAAPVPVPRRHADLRETPRERWIRRAERRGPLVVLILVCAIATAASPSFASWSDISTILGGDAFVWLLALGMTFVITTGGIDLSVGSLFALGGVLAARGVGHRAVGGDPAAARGVRAWGTVQGLLIAYARMAPFIVTLAGLLGARGLLQAITNQGSTTYLVPQGSWFLRLGAGTWVPVAIVAVLFAAGWVLMERTATARRDRDRRERELGDPARPARRPREGAGVPALRHARRAAGALGGARLGSGVTTVGVGYELTAIASVVIGGTLLTGGYGTVGGTVCGALLLAVIHQLIDRYLSAVRLGHDQHGRRRRSWPRSCSPKPRSSAPGRR